MPLLKCWATLACNTNEPICPESRKERQDIFGLV